MSEWPWRPDGPHLVRMMEELAGGQRTAPILVVRDGDRYVLVDGHNRLYAHAKMGIPEIQALLLEGDFASTEDLRQADIRLKTYDKKTQGKYGFSTVLKRWSAERAADARPMRSRRTKLLVLFVTHIIAKIRRRLLNLAFR